MMSATEPHSAYGAPGGEAETPPDIAINILLIDPHPLHRACTLVSLGESEAVNVDALDDIDAAHAGPMPNVILLQEDMSGKPQHSLPEQLARLKRRWPHALPVVISRDGDDDRLMDSLQVGVNGVLNSNADPQTWISSIRLIASGETVYPRNVIDIIRSVLNGSDRVRAALGQPSSVAEKFRQLTPRQHEVLRLLAMGLSNHKIANLLRISVSTVKVHIRAIMLQIGAENRTQIVAHYVNKTDA